MADEHTILHNSMNCSIPTDSVGNAKFLLAEASWNFTENVVLNGQASGPDVDRLHSARMDCTTHQANILDPDVPYVRFGLSMGSVAGQGGTQDALFST